MLVLLIAVASAPAISAVAAAVAVELLIRSPTIFTAVVAIAMVMAVFAAVVLGPVVLFSVFALRRRRSL
jgi:hypothetical protein